MLKSMTGFGRVEKAVGDKTFLIEIKSLNGKQFELNLKLHALLKPYEFNIRNMLSAQLQRGSVECTIVLKQTGTANTVSINTALIKTYYEPIGALAKELNVGADYALGAILRLPDVVTPATDSIQEAEWQQFQNLLQEAVAEIDKHRMNEGSALQKDLEERINHILAYQEKVAALEPLRQHKIRENLVKLLEEKVGKEQYDANRLEQELIYYIEKIDLSEEQVRLRNHCDYFLNILSDEESSKGKKLSFVLQEIGREINTTGSKANDAGIQKIVVLMKDELEKAKEQVLNVL
ncbi:MAG: YicC family protein [Bacteroidetes bacterium]|nr:YicC family protein [Bacteroidota bacterium]